MMHYDDLVHLKKMMASAMVRERNARRDVRALEAICQRLEQLELEAEDVNNRIEAAKRVGAEWKREAEELYRSIRDEPIEELP